MVKKEKKRLNTKAKTKLDKEIQKNIELTFRSRDAINVNIAGEFNNWDTQALPMSKDKEGIWKAKVKLAPGRYEYKLFADNAWVEDLPDSEAVLNSFGTSNFVILVS
jgi:1,4-alpha-glucan branching enzyme